MILFLDYDGVLHADDVYRTKKGIALKSGGTLFEHAHILAAAIEPHPEVNIVLSTSWVRELGFSRAKKYLPLVLQDRVSGSAYHTGYESVDFTGTPWGLLTRYEQIIRHVSRHNITNWIAVDNDNEGWPESQVHRLIHTDDWLGLGDPIAQQRLVSALQSIPAPVLASECGQRMVNNMDKMARDEEYRKSIAKNLS